MWETDPYTRIYTVTFRMHICVCATLQIHVPNVPNHFHLSILGSLKPGLNFQTAEVHFLKVIYKYMLSELW